MRGDRIVDINGNIVAAKNGEQIIEIGFVDGLIERNRDGGLV